MWARCNYSMSDKLSKTNENRSLSKKKEFTYTERNAILQSLLKKRAKGKLEKVR